MAWIGPVVGAGISAMGQMQTNQANQGMSNAQMAFQAQQTQQVENWETQMSDTAMQRRMADLQKAGINPLLAVSQGGASQPSVSPPGGAAIPMQNAAAAFGNMGGQIASNISAQASAQQASANANLANAQAAKISGVDTAAAGQGISESVTRQALMGAQIQAQTAQANLSQAQVQVAQAQLPKIQAEIAQLAASSSNYEAQTHLTNLQSIMQQLNTAQFQSISPYLLESAANAAKSSQLDLSGLQKQAQMNATTFGTVLPYLNSIFNWFHLGANLSASSSSSTTTRN